MSSFQFAPWAGDFLQRRKSDISQTYHSTASTCGQYKLFLLWDGNGQRNFPIRFLLAADRRDAGLLDLRQLLHQPAQKAPDIWRFGHRFGRWGGKQAADVSFRLADRHILMDDHIDGGQLVFLLRQLQKRRAWRSVSPAGSDGIQNRRTVAQQPQLIGHGGLALSDAVRRLLLGEMTDLHEPGQSLRFFNKIQIPPLEIFHQRRDPGLGVVHVHQQARHLLQPRQPCCPQPPFAGQSARS